MFQKNPVPAAIISGAVIIGFFIYLGLSNSSEIIGGRGVRLASHFPELSPVNSRANTPEAVCGVAENTIVTKVIDGDTVVVEGGQHVRLIGIDTDEKGYACFDAAKKRLEELVLSKNVVLEKDVSDVDQYQRCLRNIFFDNKNIGLQMVQEGLAVARFYPPDVRYKAEISAAEKEAIASKTGCKWN